MNRQIETRPSVAGSIVERHGDTARLLCGVTGCGYRSGITELRDGITRWDCPACGTPNHVATNTRPKPSVGPFQGPFISRYDSKCAGCTVKIRPQEWVYRRSTPRGGIYFHKLCANRVMNAERKAAKAANGDRR